ncbi:hypothetical protein [Streptomyces mutabilis]|uniref:Uncharacterized protein n=1 Tax=Streptomyces mutabilis TaxID=67332 RepID=A0A086MZZ3_9ACTN|nr:hypothetical protein [Streptomyces mutabilis]KFG74461.1 hypothetical protein FM21_27335 [Streptomyces mutabilis]
MRKLWWAVPVAAVGAAAVRRSRPAHRADERAGDRWLTVTVNRPPTDVKGAERVISIDRVPERLAMTERYVGAETIDYTSKTDGCVRAVIRPEFEFRGAA